MAISQREHITHICSNCQSAFPAEVWLVLDAQEQPDDVELLRQERLNIATCPHCGHTQQIEVSFLFHDSAGQRVIFAANPGITEHEWHKQAYALHDELIAAIPVEERRPYLEDVHMTQGIAGVAHILRKVARRSARNSADRPKLPGRDIAEVLGNVSAAQQHPTTVAEPATQTPYAPQNDLETAIQALVTADTPAGLQAIVDTYPVLRSATADTTIGQLADEAVAQRAHELAESLHRARVLLRDLQMRDSLDSSDYVDQPIVTDQVAPMTYTPVSNTDGPQEIPAEAYQALLQVQTSETLQRVVQIYPVLLEPWVDSAIAHQVNQALDEGNERLAHNLEERRELLAIVRPTGHSYAAAQLAETPAAYDTDVQAAIDALFVAPDEDTMAQVLIDYPILLEDTAHQVLGQIAADARNEGDEVLASYALECQTMLRRIREEWKE